MEINFSLLNIFFKASLSVKFVMLGLIFSSIWGWGIILNRARCIAGRFKAYHKFQTLLNSGVEILTLYKQISAQKHKIGVEAIFFKGVNEFLHLSKGNNFKPKVIMQEVKRTMVVALGKEHELLEKNLTTLATIQSISPYVGLFGTILGIISVFHQLSVASGQATLAVVAPGISEALIATAMGLLAAIPAGIFYNKFVGKIDWLLAGYQRSMQELIGAIGKRIHFGNTRSLNMVDNT